MNVVQRKSAFLFIAILLFVISFGYFAYGQHKQRMEEGLVYLSLFKPNSYIKQYEHMVVLSRPSVCMGTEANFKKLSQETLSNFLKMNAEGRKPIRLSALEGKVPIVSWNDTQELYEKGNEYSFKPEKKDLYLLSRVGFNKQKNKAIACLEIRKKSFGEGLLLYFEKHNNEWTLIRNKNIWIT